MVRQRQVSRGSGMSSRDAEPKSSTIDRVAFLDQLLCKRLEEIEAAEARLQRRFEQVNESEQRLVNLQVALKQSIAVAGGAINQIDAAKTDVGKLAEVAATTSAHARELMETLPKSVAARIEVLKGEVERTLTAASKRVASQCEKFEQRAMIFEEWLERQV